MTQKSKSFLLAIAGVLTLGACGDKSPYIPDEPIVPVTPTPDEPPPTPEKPEKPSGGPTAADLEAWNAPSYADHYGRIAGWDQRSSWNLANIHDPSVVKGPDGYFYMYQTDASFGNAHDGHGHFHCRRSKDLVNWQYLGATMPTLPDWVIPKLNEIRTAMGVAEKHPGANEFGYWAPVVRKVKDGLYRMYYSIVCPGYIDGNNTWGERAFI